MRKHRDIYGRRLPIDKYDNDDHTIVLQSIENLDDMEVWKIFADSIDYAFGAITTYGRASGYGHHDLYI